MKKIDGRIKATIIFMLILVFTMIYDILVRGGGKVGRILLTAITIIGAYFLCKISFLKKSNIIYYLILIFIFASMYMANIWNIYTYISYFDKILHLGSGFILAIIGYVLFLHLCGSDNSTINPVTGVIFTILFATAAAAVWEIHEFTTDKLFGLLSQNNSLLDTMQDIICGTVTGIIASVPIYLHSKGRKVAFVDKIIEEIKEKNN